MPKKPTLVFTKKKKPSLVFTSKYKGKLPTVQINKIAKSDFKKKFT